MLNNQVDEEAVVGYKKPRIYLVANLDSPRANSLKQKFSDTSLKISSEFSIAVWKESDFKRVIIDSVTVKEDIELCIQNAKRYCPVIVNVGIKDFALARSCFKAGATDCVLSLEDAFPFKQSPRTHTKTRVTGGVYHE